MGQGFKNQLAAAKSLQSCPTLCEPIDGSPSGSTVPEILQARTPEWVALSFSNAWKWKVKVKSLSRVRLLVTPRTAAYQPPPSMGFSRQEYWSGVPLPSPKNQLSWVILTQSLLWSCGQGGDLGFHPLKACLGLRSSSKLTHMIAGGVLSSSTCESLHRDAGVLTTWYLSGESEWWEGERQRDPPRETETEREIYYKTVSWVNHQPIHYSLWEGNESLSSTHAQEEQIKLHLLKGVSKNFWPYFKTSVCVCECVCIERERESWAQEKAKYVWLHLSKVFQLFFCLSSFAAHEQILHPSKPWKWKFQYQLQPSSQEVWNCSLPGDLF